MTTNNPAHDESMRAYALHLMFIDGVIRDRIVQMQLTQTTHLIYEKLPEERRATGFAVLGEIVKTPRRPLSHELRQLLATALEIECPDIKDIPRMLIHMREYPL